MIEVLNKEEWVEVWVVVMVLMFDVVKVKGFLEVLLFYQVEVMRLLDDEGVEVFFIEKFCWIGFMWGLGVYVVICVGC